MNVHAVFEGGGVKAIALAGAVKTAEQHGIIFSKVAGTSSGAIIASLLAAGYSADEIKDLILHTPFNSFLHRSGWHRVPYIGEGVRLILKKGLYSGDRLEYWIKNKLQAKGIRTFADLEQGKLQIIASDISMGKLLILPDGIARYGYNPQKLEVAKAVRMSTSLPFFFDPVMIKNSPSGYKAKYIYIVDGGILSNFPLWIFDKENEQKKKITPVLGFNLVGKNEKSPREIHGPLTMLRALFSTMMDAHDEKYIEEVHRFRTINVETPGVYTTQFDLGKEKSMEIFQSGMDAAEQFFRDWSISGYLNKYEQYLRAIK